MEVARLWYKDHQKLKLLEKLRHQVKPTPELQAVKWRRLEKRTSTLILKALPQDVVSAKDLSVLGMICRLMLNYQPGGGQEKQAVLAASLHRGPETSVKLSVGSNLGFVGRDGRSPMPP